jgi:hypothetical protein
MGTDEYIIAVKPDDRKIHREPKDHVEVPQVSPAGYNVEQTVVTRIIQLFTASVALSAFVPLAAAAACNDYDFEFEASPSFIAPSMIRVHGESHSSGISVVIGDDKLVEKLPLNAAAAEEFCTRIQQAITIDQSKDERMGFDGISVRGHWRLASLSPYEFSFWSPDKQKSPRDYAIADAVFSVLESTTPSCLLNAYLEQLSTYFSFGLPARELPGPPLTLRFYGSLSIDHDEDLGHLIESLPADTPLTIDMTNFGGMGLLLYSTFRPLLARSPVVHWVAAPRAATQLRELGVKPTAIEVIQTLYCEGQPMRFSRR